VRRTFRNGANKKHELMKQASLEGGVFDDVGGDESDDSNGGGDTPRDDPNALSDEDLPPTPPRPATPLPMKGLPWTPKVRQRDLDVFLDHTRIKFVGFNVKNNVESLAGLPHPIHEGVRVLNQHLYVSLCEIQVSCRLLLIYFDICIRISAALSAHHDLAVK